MTEQEWTACADPMPMLEFLRQKTSDRKLRLFTVACCRTIWTELTADCVRRSVDIAEQYADRSVPVSVIGAIVNDLYQGKRALLEDAAITMYGAVQEILSPVLEIRQILNLIQAIWWFSAEAGKEIHRRECQAIRDIFGNPFRSLAVDRRWLTSTVVPLAQAIYNDRAFDRLPILADALEEAGCDHGDILAHCRQSGQHVRGCWALDLLIGKD